MGLYKLKIDEDDIHKGVLERVISQSIDYEKVFESWLENSPDVLQDEETILWIGRQINIQVGDTNKYPDLIGVNSSGDIVICELKKGKTPRDVIAQILEYSSWASSLTYDNLNNITKNYYINDPILRDKDLVDIYKEVFYPESEEDLDIIFNKSQKLYIVAEEISKTVVEVINYLNKSYSIPIVGIEYSVYKTKGNEYIVSTNKCCGSEMKVKQVSDVNTLIQNRWSDDLPVKEVVYNAVIELITREEVNTFKPIQIIREVEKKYPSVNKTTVRCQLIQNCVNHTSRKHYPNGQRDMYYIVSKGNYRLFNESIDGKWNYRGERVDK